MQGVEVQLKAGRYMQKMLYVSNTGARRWHLMVDVEKKRPAEHQARHESQCGLDATDNQTACLQVFTVVGSRDQGRRGISWQGWMQEQSWDMPPGLLLRPRQHEFNMGGRYGNQ